MAGELGFEPTSLGSLLIASQSEASRPACLFCAYAAPAGV